MSSGVEEIPEVRGSKVEVKVLNEIWDKQSCQYKVIETSPDTLSERDMYAEYVCVLRRKFGKDKKDCSTYLDIKSEELRDALQVVLNGVRAISLWEDKPTIPTNIMLNFLPQLKTHQENLSPDSIGAKHLQGLMGFLETHFAPTTKSLLPLLDHGEINFDLLWALFKPNTHVFTICEGSDQPRCLIYDSGNFKTSPFGEKSFELDCHYLGYDGKVFGEVKTTLSIPEFRSTIKIASLNVFPLEHHRRQAEIRQHFISNGRKFVSLRDINHREYEGIAFFKTKDGPSRFSTSGRIMVDAIAFHRQNPNYGKQAIVIDLYGISVDNQVIKQQGDVKSQGLVPEEIGDEEYLICPPTVLAFSLADKKWGEFAVANIKDIEWNALAFSSLAIEEDKKTVLQGLVKSYQSGSGKSRFDDVIKGKGKGLVFLLHGPPGVGKTLTAEALAESEGRPLYVASAGDLDTDPARLEQSLAPIVENVHRWSAVLLLDEADIFLAQRTLTEVQRNSLVSVFLRQMEYLQGIMFLTTNRVTVFDEAIQSRIHLALRYDELKGPAREQVWKTFLKRADAAANISRKDMQTLLGYLLNGRQIKNAIRTGYGLAECKGEKLAYEHLRKAITLNQDFEYDLKGIGSVENLRSYV
ncbi:P-loop containing nucleoside triphosphate hydrolase protein [Glonium stellatum]|uniref:P-loop containing nucleoside triphosphate hydrolase protein n=1 Tax=Glonium stellatum TaxID=574774 RepID=A0A8E2JPQ8_9PEZI|nr:P-loop containing nucleoside triphosphate hydrolase protein [Glonium stellatum]